MRPTLYLKSVLGVALVYLFTGCSPQVESEVIGGGGNSTATNPGSTETPGGTGGTTENINGSEEGEDFFDGKIVAAFKTGTACLRCHDAPRNVLDVPDASDERIYDYGKMFALLRKGNFSNDNGFINPMLGKVEHPGATICRNEETDLCALAIEWYNLEFAGAVASLGLVDKVEVSGASRHDIVGYAKDIDDPNSTLTVSGYIDGPKGTGTPIGEVQATNNYTSDVGAHGYRLTVPAAMLDNTVRQLHIYAVKDGEEVELAGSPVTFLALTQTNTAFPGTGGLGINAGGCACHAAPATEFSYDNLWPDLAQPANDNLPLGPTNNKGYAFTQGGENRGGRHPAGPQGNANSYIQWFCAEFNNSEVSYAGCSN